MVFLYFSYQFGFIKGSAAVASVKCLDTGSVALCFLRFYFDGFRGLSSDVFLSAAVRGGS
jgi:hypothetical protein